MQQHITAIQSEDDRERVLLRIQELSGPPNNRPTRWSLFS
jgi:hypothetical protein